MIFAFPVFLFLLVVWVLTALAWVEGLRAMARAGEAKADMRRRILPPMLLLTVLMAILFGFFILRIGRVVSLAWPGRMAIIGAFSAIAALITSMRAPRGFRGLAIAASTGWLVCFGLVLTALFALRGLR